MKRRSFLQTMAAFTGLLVAPFVKAGASGDYFPTPKAEDCTVSQDITWFVDFSKKESGDGLSPKTALNDWPDPSMFSDGQEEIIILPGRTI